MSYTDRADDAYGSAPHAALSQPAYDILRVGWSPAAEVDEQRTGGYSTSITVAGTARNDGSYVSYGEFRSDVRGEYCQLYHFLTPGITAFANAFCGSIGAGTRRFIGRVEGSQVTATPTTAGGTLLVATFDDAALPPLLEARGRMLSRVAAFTCSGGPDSRPEALTCAWHDVLDYADSGRSYRI